MAVLLLAGCTSSLEGSTSPAGAARAGQPLGCATSERAAPAPDRPVIDLEFRLDDDLRTVTGTETVTFTPDRPVAEMWFRLIPNAPQSEGHRLTVDDVRGDAVAGGEHVDADAVSATPGGLYRVDLNSTVAAGSAVTVELDFTLRLTADRTPAGFDRLGVGDDVAWWAGGYPSLAWEPGVGWARDPFVRISAETTTTAVADTTIRVSAPEDLVVLMTGDQQEPRSAADGRRIWESREPVARDVSVAAGDFDTAAVETGGTEVTVGVLPGADTSAEELADDTVDAIRRMEGRFGPFPYATLTVPLVATGDDGGGEEYASSILLGGADYGLILHEVAHMWFYGMVGNSQFRDPWLDEAFASFAESLGPDAHTHEEALRARGDVGGSMADFDDQDEYEELVYGKGAEALARAREVAGDEAFDEALRCYADTQAWTIARPEDVARALAESEPALEVLVEAGALDPRDLAPGGE